MTIKSKYEWKELSRDEFVAWNKNYPKGRVERDVNGVYEPPLVTWNDFTLAPTWPDSTVAWTEAESGVYHIRLDLYEKYKG
jgi:hypothetical protein